MKLFKHCFSAFVLFSLTFNIVAQTIEKAVGIDRIPTTTLDVNGGVKINKFIYLGGNDNQIGQAGSYDWALACGGDDEPAQWLPVGSTLPKQGNYFLQQTIIKNDNNGGIVIPYRQLSGSTAYNTDFNIDTEAGQHWTAFDDLTFSLVPQQNPRRFVFQLEIVVSSDYTSNTAGWNSFAIGLAIDNPKGSGRILKAVRTASCLGTNHAQQLFYMTFVMDDVIFDSSTTNKVYVVAAYRNCYPTAGNRATLYFGCDIPGQTGGSQTLLKKATMRIDVYEKFRD